MLRQSYPEGNNFLKVINFYCKFLSRWLHKSMGQTRTFFPVRSHNSKTHRWTEQLFSLMMMKDQSNDIRSTSDHKFHRIRRSNEGKYSTQTRLFSEETPDGWRSRNKTQLKESLSALGVALYRKSGKQIATPLRASKCHDRGQSRVTQIHQKGQVAIWPRGSN